MNYGSHVLGRLIQAGDGEGSVGSLLRAVFVLLGRLPERTMSVGSLL